MNLNRRNVLIGIATVAMIAGAALGSGAFTTVEADRALSITTVDDSDAYVGISDSHPLVTNGSGNNGQAILQINLDQLNDDATTTLNPAFTVTNNLGEGVGVRITSSVSGVSVTSETNNEDISTFPTAAGDDNNLAASGSMGVNITIDTSTATDASGTITIEADTSEFN